MKIQTPGKTLVKGFGALNRFLGFLTTKIDLILLGLLFIFFLMRIYLVNRPGLYADEIFVPYLALQTQLQVSSLETPFVSIFGYKFPLGISPQSGGLPIYPQLMLAYITGNPFAHRILSILYGCISIVFFYFFLKSFLNKKIALLSVLILTLMPAHIFYSRTDPYFILRLSILSFMFYVFHKWYLNKDWKCFYLGCLGAGLGVSTRLEMVMPIIAFLTYLIFFNTGLLKEVIKISKASVTKMAAGFFFLIMGALFYILFNIMSSYNILDFFTNESILKTGDILNAYLSNIVVRIVQIRDYFNCGNPFGEIRGTYCNPIPFYVLLLFLIIALWTVVSKRFKGSANKKMEFLIIMPVLVFIQSIPSTSLGPFHNLIILPFLVAILSYGLSLARRVLSLILILLLITSYINIDVRYYKNLSSYNEAPLWSSAIFDLVKALEKENGKTVYAGDWGLSRLVFYISHGEVQAKEIFGYTSDSDFFVRQLENEHRNPNNIYIFYFQNVSGFNRLNAFRHFMKERRIIYREVPILNKEGNPVYVMCTLQATPQAAPAGVAKQSVPTLSKLYPARTRTGSGFNVQASGESALSLECANATPNTVVIFDNTALATTYGNSRWVTALVPKKVYSKPGRYRVFLRSEGGDSNRLEFVVEP